MRHGQFTGLVSLQTSFGFYPKIQFQLPVNPVYTLMIVTVALHITQIQKTQPKAPGPIGLVRRNSQLAIWALSPDSFGWYR